MSVDPMWWKNSTVYQIYPRSFMDGNGDGIGDLAGITQRISYLKQLGVDIVWISPIYRSPMVDNGYDISNYDTIDPLFGDLDDFDAMVATAHDAGLKIVMDLVVNHSSDQHVWFQESRDPSSPKHDWYIWREARPEGPANPDAGPMQWRGDEPNPWQSAFSGPVWKWDEEVGKYYLHFFAAGQPDLNWENDEVRAEIFAMMRRWIRRGVDGFRMDVINLISKPKELYTDTAGSLDRTFFGPRFHEWMQEMRREVFDRFPDRELFTVGETPGATVEEAHLMTDPARRELDMVFQFEHMSLDATHGDKFTPKPLHLPDMKNNLAHWTHGLAGRGWNSLYLCNHDQPRPVSRYGSDQLYRYESATAWGGMLHAHQGTPFVYQGEELGMTNFPWSDISQFDDVEIKGLWQQRVIDEGADPEALWPGIVYISRDNARTPVQWDATPHAGFTSGTPWLPINPNYTEINAASQVGVAGSVFEFYRRMIALRKEHSVLVDGSFELIQGEHPTLWWIRRTLDDITLEAFGNFSDDPLWWDLPAGEVLLSNQAPGSLRANQLAPWELRWVLR